MLVQVGLERLIDGRLGKVKKRKQNPSTNWNPLRANTYPPTEHSIPPSHFPVNPPFNGANMRVTFCDSLAANSRLPHAYWRGERQGREKNIEACPLSLCSRPDNPCEIPAPLSTGNKHIGPQSLTNYHITPEMPQKLSLCSNGPFHQSVAPTKHYAKQQKRIRGQGSGV